MAKKENIGKHVVIFGFEGTGKTLLLEQIVRMKLHSHSLNEGDQKPPKIKLFVICSEEKNKSVKALHQYLKDCFEDIPIDVADCEFDKIIGKLEHMEDDLIATLQNMIKEDKHNYDKLIIAIDEFQYDFKENEPWNWNWGILRKLSKKVEVVLSVSHYKTEYILRSLHGGMMNEKIMKNEYIMEKDSIIYCYLDKNYRNEEEISYLTHLTNLHATSDKNFDPNKIGRILSNKNFDPKNIGKIVFNQDSPREGLETWKIKDFKKFKEICKQKLNRDKSIFFIVRQDIKEDYDNLASLCQSKANKWYCFRENEITGLEAHTVILYNLKEFNFEVFTRAMNKLIVVFDEV